MQEYRDDNQRQNYMESYGLYDVIWSYSFLGDLKGLFIVEKIFLIILDSITTIQIIIDEGYQIVRLSWSLSHISLFELHLIYLLDKFYDL